MPGVAGGIAVRGLQEEARGRELGAVRAEPAQRDGPARGVLDEVRRLRRDDERRHARAGAEVRIVGQRALAQHLELRVRRELLARPARSRRGRRSRGTRWCRSRRRAPGSRCASRMRWMFTIVGDRRHAVVGGDDQRRRVAPRPRLDRLPSRVRPRGPSATTALARGAGAHARRSARADRARGSRRGSGAGAARRAARSRPATSSARVASSGKLSCSGVASTMLASGPRALRARAVPVERGRAHALPLGRLVQVLAARHPVGVAAVVVSRPSPVRNLLVTMP